MNNEWWGALRQLDIGAGFGFLDELEEYAVAQVVAALERGNELSFNPDVLRFDENEHARFAHGFVKKPGIAVLKDLPPTTRAVKILRLWITDGKRIPL